MSAWLVVGLGNPGDRYASSRHNIGARVVERLSQRWGRRLRKVRFLAAEAAEGKLGGETVWLLRPAAFMNVSGPPVASFARKRKVDVDRIVACHDEIDLSFGSLKLKQGGSTAGHNGLRSLVQALGDDGFHRVRLGVGRPPGREDPADYVLEPFAKGERDEAGLLVEKAADAVETLIREGLGAAQDRFNRVPPRDE
ncbi:MAG TPA: aminoacyl-tRNA hydrolase [Actinomycetota bacterium]|nr:aminoacyl-tRNA hydrolase [Actinomycetota bacterium]